MRLKQRATRLQLIAAIAAALGASTATLSGSVSAFALAQPAIDRIAA